MAEIELSRGLVALVDDEDLDFLLTCKWYANETTAGNIYAQARIRTRRIYMHRVVARAQAGQHVHHKNGCTLDNRKSNLETLTPKEHRFIHVKETPSGVYIQGGRYRALLRIHGARISLGLHDDRADALRAVAMARELLPGLPEDELKATAKRIVAAARRRAVRRNAE